MAVIVSNYICIPNSPKDVILLLHKGHDTAHSFTCKGMGGHFFRRV